MRRVSSVVSPILNAVEWVFGSTLPLIDIVYGALATAWLGMMLARPDLFDTRAYAGMQWMPDQAWIAYLVVLLVLHVTALVATAAWQVRAAACLASAWYWLLISLSLTRTGVVTGTWTYLILGIVAVAAAIYVSGRSAVRR